MKKSLFCAALVLFISCRKSEAPVPSAPPHAAAQGNQMLSVPPQEMRDLLARTFRLKVDQRFLLAIGDVDRILTGRSVPAAQTSFAGGQWHVSYGGREIGVLPELPSYDDAFKLLTAFAGSLPSPAATPCPDTARLTAAVEEFEVPREIAALHEIDACWKSTHATELLAPAARALSYLVLQQYDRFDVGDELQAKALAAVVVASVKSRVDLKSTQALVASVLGYGAVARAFAAQLPAVDAVRLYLLADHAGVSRAASAPSAPLATKYFHLLLVVRHGELKDWLAALDTYGKQRQLSPALAKTGILLGQFGTHAELTRMLPDLATYEMTGEATTTAAELAVAASAPEGLARLMARVKHGKGNIVDDFESSLKRTDEGFSGPFLDGPARDAYFRAALYSGVYGYAEHQLDWLSSTETSKNIAGALGQPRDPRAAQYGRWFHDLAAWKSSEAPLQTLLDDLAHLDLVGEPALQRTYEELQKNGAYSDPRAIESVRFLFARCDSRPSQRYDAAAAAHQTLFDVRLAEKLYGSAARDFGEDEPNIQVWLAAFFDDSATLRRLANDRAFDADARADAYDKLVKSHIIDETAYRQRMRALLQEVHGRWEVFRDYYHHLKDHDGEEEIAAIAPKWIEEHGDADPFEIWAARTWFSHALLTKHDVTGAWAVIAPAIEGGKEDVLLQASRVYDAQGQREKARDLARQAIDRYPDSGSARVTLAEILWREHADADAAAVFANPDARFSEDDWREAGRSFLDVFGTAPDAGEAAFQQLVSAGVPPFKLQQVAGVVSVQEKWELAFRMLSQLKWPSAVGQLDLTNDAYEQLRRWKGDVEALSWIQSVVPKSSRGPLSVVVFPRGDLSLLWTVVETPPGGEERDFVWLMRTAATLLSPGLRAAHGREVQAFVADTSHGGDYVVMARYLLGLTDEASLLKRAVTPQRRCEIAYYIGLKAMSEYRLADASDWFRVACETAQTNQGELRWAKDALSLWAGESRSLTAIARRPAVK